jgi:histidine ammonia-lyase
VLALEALGAAQALDLRAPLEPGASSRAAVEVLRGSVPFIEVDREFGPDIAEAVRLVRAGDLAAAAESVTGPLG